MADEKTAENITIIKEESNFLAEREFTSLLISLYRESPELWNAKSKDYLNKYKRSAALAKMLEVLKTQKPDYNEDKLKRKINVLRTNFNKEYQKMCLKRRSGYKTEPNLWYYEDFIFVKDGAEVETIETPLSDDAKRKSPSAHALVPLKKAKVPSNTTEEHVNIPSSYYDIPNGEAELLAKSWSMKLNRLTPDQKLFAEKIINDTLFEAEMGTLTRYGVSFLTSSAPAVSPATYLESP